MSFVRRGIYFDKQDRDILVLVNRILESDNKPSDNCLFDPSLHPHGIKELVASPAVSYTHLDVYKRQGRGRCHMSVPRFDEPARGGR